jgi:hypothetical protein
VKGKHVDGFTEGEEEGMHLTKVVPCPVEDELLRLGGPVGFRMILAHPERVEALIVQDAVAHNEGLGVNWKTRRTFWADRAANESTCAPI